jgi:D-serine deaminase-like pyridoxal phosphate-dependent protein
VLRRLRRHPVLHEVGVRDAALLTRLPLAVPRGLRRVRVDGERLLVADDEVDLARRPVRDVISLEIGHHRIGVALAQVAVAAAGALADHVELALVGELEAHAHVMGGVARLRERSFISVSKSNDHLSGSDSM